MVAALTEPAFGSCRGGCCRRLPLHGSAATVLAHRTRRHGHRLGWSTQSTEEALAVANERLANSLKAIRAGLPRDKRGSYGWAPPREETLRELRDDDGTLTAIVSRNRYGADVIGTDRLLIADVDVPRDRPVARSLFRLFGGKKGKSEDDGPKARALRLIQDFATTHPSLGVRAYETFAGFRVIVTGSGLEPRSAEAVALFEQLGTDQIYVHLCRKYNTCRARLTRNRGAAAFRHRPGVGRRRRMTSGSR